MRAARLLPLLLLAALLAAPAHARPAAGSAPQRMQVVQDEWFLNLSRQRLRPGLVTIEVVNFGQDAHDLVLQRNAKGAKAVRVRALDHFQRAELTTRLVAGRYTLWCSLPNHRARGMVAPLTVR